MRPTVATTDPAETGVHIEISPNPAFMDEETSVSVLGLAPTDAVTLLASTEDDDRRRWCSRATLMPGETGAIDLSSSECLAGSYRGVSTMGLFWSMSIDEADADERAAFAKKNAAPNRVLLEIEVNHQKVASADLERRYSAPGTEMRDLAVAAKPGGNPEHTIGRLFIPPESQFRWPRPVAIVLSGSGGGFDLDKAALLAHRGFAALALAYFGIPPLPAWLHRIPLDYFEAALTWLSAQPEVDATRIGVLAVSRGAELALLLGSRFPQVGAVVAYAPSSVAWAAGGRDKATGEIIPSWTHRGEAVPFAPLPLRQFILRSAVPVALLKKPVMFRDLFRAGLRNAEAIHDAAIPVERIRGPIMLVSGGDDHLWPASEMSDAIVARLKRHHFTHRVEHLHYPHAGHMLRYPYLPTTARHSGNPHLRNARYSFGGSASADALAQADSWRRAIEFLKASLE